jgi:AraC-like DNA-binding protein
LEAGAVFGPWRGRAPAGQRRRAKFVPALYGDDHAHEHAELCLLLEGRCLFSLDHAAAVLQAGDLVVCPAGHAHAEAFVRGGEGYRLAWWSLHPTEPTLHVTRYARRGGFAMDHRMSLAILPAEAQRRLQVLRSLAAAGRPPDVDMLREAMLTLALALYRRVIDGGEAQLDTRAQLVRRAVEFVRTQADRPLALSDVARAVHVSPNYLTGLFRGETGTPLGRFILGERIARSQQRLREPGASVKTVALDLGFGDPFTFSRAFKRVTGQPPRVWQAQQQGV